MIEIVKNKNNLLESDINNEVTRVKALIITSDNKILLGHSHCEYQFPGGHIEAGEDLLLGLRRELKEETGLEFDTSNLNPFVVRNSYYKDYPSENVNNKIVIYYYVINDDRIPDLKKTNYTLEELDGNFSLRYIPLEIVNDVLKENMEMSGDTSGISREMLEVLDCFNKINV